jgi:hypothetical protein
MSISDEMWFRRTILTAAGVLLIVLIAVPTLHLLGRPEPLSSTSEAPNPHLKALERMDLHDDENAAKWLVAGASAVVWSEEEQQLISSASLTPYKEWSEELRAQVRATVDRHQGALVTLHNAAAVKGSSFQLRYSEGLGMEVPNLLVLLRAARLLVCEARVAFADSEPERGLQALASISRMATSLAGESTLITALVSIAVERMMLVVATEITADEAAWVDSRFFDDVEALVPRHTSRETLQRVLGAWEAVVNDAVKRGGGELAFPADLKPADVRKAAASVEELLMLTYGSHRKSFEPLLRNREESEADGIATDLGGFAIAIGRAQSVAAQRQLLRAAITMRKLGADTGQYPRERQAIPELSEPDRFTGNLIDYTANSDGTLTLALHGAAELLAPITLTGSSEIMVPVTLPAPR